VKFVDGTVEGRAFVLVPEAEVQLGLAIAIVGETGTPRIENDRVALDLNGDGEPETFAECTSHEGLTSRSAPAHRRTPWCGTATSTPASTWGKPARSATVCSSHRRKTRMRTLGVALMGVLALGSCARRQPATPAAPAVVQSAPPGIAVDAILPASAMRETFDWSHRIGIAGRDAMASLSSR
jgi:hypothetical protein